MLRRLLVLALTVTIAAGCGVSQASIDDAAAKVRGGLEAWKKGGKPDDLKAATPPVEFNEAMWSAGEALVAYEPGKVAYIDKTKVVRCEFVLTVRKPRGKDRKENVTYDVTLGPTLKVVNNPMP